MSYTELPEDYREKLKIARTRYGAGLVSVGAKISASSLQDFITGKREPVQADTKNSITKYLTDMDL